MTDAVREIPPPTERLAFHEMTPADEPDMQRLLGDPRVMWVYPEPLDSAGVRAWINRNTERFASRGFGLWVATKRDTGEFVGECGLVPQTVDGIEEIEVGYHVLPELWGQGFAPEAVGACLAFARDTLGLHRICALIDPRNVASQRVAAKTGLTHERDVQFPTKILRVYATAL